MLGLFGRLLSGQEQEEGCNLPSHHTGTVAVSVVPGTEPGYHDVDCSANGDRMHCKAYNAEVIVGTGEDKKTCKASIVDIDADIGTFRTLDGSVDNGRQYITVSFRGSAAIEVQESYEGFNVRITVSR